MLVVQFLRSNHKTKVIRVGIFLSVPTTLTVIRVGFLFFRVPTADVRYLLVSLQYYPVIPVSKKTLVLAAWINIKVGTPIKQNQLSQLT